MKAKTKMNIKYYNKSTQYYTQYSQTKRVLTKYLQLALKTFYVGLLAIGTYIVLVGLTV